MSSMLDWAEEELKRYNFDFYGDSMNKAVLEVLKTLSDQGHTNMSASIVISLVDRLWSWKPLTPLTGEDDEWISEPKFMDHTLQNKRYSAVFKDKETGECYDVEGIVFEEPYEDHYVSFTCNKSKVPVTFPYMPPDRYPRYRLKYNTDEKSVEDQLRDNEYEIV